MPTAIPLWLDLMAVGVGAVFGGAVTNRRGAPIVGVLVAGVVLGLGGGIMRDVILGVTPVAISSPWYVGTAAACALVGGLLARRLSAESGLLVLLDAWALAMFVVIGAGKAMALGVSPDGGDLPGDGHRDRRRHAGRPDDRRGAGGDGVGTLVRECGPAGVGLLRGHVDPRATTRGRVVDDPAARACSFRQRETRLGRPERRRLAAVADHSRSMSA
jgi:hypothetical protein